MEWPKVESSFSKSQSEYKFIGGSWLPVLMSSTLLCAIFLPYLIVLGRGTLDPFLPFISQVGGSPPQSGVFSLFLILSSLLAFIGLNLFYMGICLQTQRLKDDCIRGTATFLNKITLLPGHLGILGILIVGSYPIDFLRHTEQWWLVTIIPHLLGALLLFLGGLFYCILITYVLNLVYPDRKQMLGIRMFLISIITMCSALQGYTVNDGFTNDYDRILTNCAIQAEDVPYNMSYLISSVSEWCLVLGFTVFFMTLKEEARDINFSMCITMRENEVDKKETETDKNKS